MASAEFRSMARRSLITSLRNSLTRVLQSMQTRTSRTIQALSSSTAALQLKQRTAITPVSVRWAWLRKASPASLGGPLR